MAETAKHTAAKKQHRLAKKSRTLLPLIPYGLPDLKVVVRLLPPTLAQNDFWNQATQLSPTLQNAAGMVFYYHQGTRSTNAFEEPVFSRAYFEFDSAKTAQNFKKDMHNASFSEPETGDHLRCELMKPIFGEVAVAQRLDAPGEFQQSLLFETFAARKKESDAPVDLKALIEEIQALEKKKKKKRKPKPKPDEAKKTKVKKEQKPKAAPDAKPKPKKKKGKSEAKPEAKPESKSEGKPDEKGKPEKVKTEKGKAEKVKAEKKAKTEEVKGDDRTGKEEGASTDEKKKKRKPKPKPKPKATKTPGDAKADQSTDKEKRPPT